MSYLRGFTLAMIGCLVVEVGIYYGLVGLGADGLLIVTAVMIWLVPTVWITISVAEHFERK
jgi:hypothetical protein